MAWASAATELLWRSAIGCIPLCLLVVVICRYVRCRPATRHTLWLCLLVSLAIGPLMPSFSPFSSAAKPSIVTSSLQDNLFLARESEDRPTIKTEVAVGADDVQLFCPRISNDPAIANANENRPDDVSICSNTFSPASIAQPELSSDDAIASSRTIPTPPRTVAQPGQETTTKLASSPCTGRVLSLSLTPKANSFASSPTRNQPVPSHLRGLHLGWATKPVYTSPQPAFNGSGRLIAACFVISPGIPANLLMVPFFIEPIRRVLEGDVVEPRDTHSYCSAPSFDQSSECVPLPSKEVPARTLTSESNKPDGSRRTQVMNTPVEAFRSASSSGSRIKENERGLVATFLSRWITGLVAVRDAVGRLPAIPGAFWLVGIALIISYKVWRVIRFTARLKQGVCAPDDVVGDVARAARKMGLAHAPNILLVDDAISPMVWCGRRAYLILPAGLWNELDDTGRQAVIFHELAHLRRRDHWICWVEEIIAAIYWWNPVMLWIRSRLREEADNCCDAWVTWLLPGHRAAYATALLRTRQFVSTTEKVPAMAVGFTSARAKRFGRRLTMVMTERNSPRGSVYGLALALAVMTAGWIATPARSSDSQGDVAKATTVNDTPPPSPKAVEVVKGGVIVQPGVTGKTVVRPAETPIPPVAAVAPRQPEAPRWSANSAPRAGSLAIPREPSQPLGGRLSRAGGDDHMEARLNRLESQLARLADLLEQGHQDHVPMIAGIPAPEQIAIAPVHGHVTHADDHQPRPIKQRSPKPVEASSPRAEVRVSGDEIVKTYKMGSDKAQALAKLLVRDDVPLRVRPVEEGIEVHGTAGQHDAFKAFVDMIESNQEQVVAYRISKEKLEALSEFMVRDDVPVLVNPGDDAIRVHGIAPVQAVFEGFLGLIEPGATGQVENESRAPRTRQEKQMLERELREKARRGAGSNDAAAIERMHEAKRLAELEQAGKLDHVRSRLDQIRRQSEELQRKSEKLQEKAEELRQNAERMRQQAEAKNGDEEEPVALALAEAADVMDRQAEEIDRQAEALEAEADATEQEADGLEDSLEHEEDEHDSDDHDDADHDSDSDDEDAAR